MLLWLGLLLAVNNNSTATAAQDTIFLQEVKVQPAATGPVNRLVAENFVGKNPEQLLRQLSSVYVKNYGYGQLSSLAVRGTNASQSVVEWNGINLNSVFLGQSDLSLHSIGLHDAYALDAAPMKGNIGGSLGLINQAQFEKRTAVSAHFRYGSFGTHALQAGFQLGHPRVYFRTVVFRTQSRNNYSYEDKTSPTSATRELKNAEWQQLSTLSQLSVKTGAQQSLSLLFWSNHSQRKLPRFFTDAAPNKQGDSNLRAQLLWQQVSQRYSLHFNSTYLNDQLLFEMPGPKPYKSNSRSQVVRNKFSSTVQEGAFSFQNELRIDYEQARTREFSQTHQRWVGGITSTAAYKTGNARYCELQLGFREEVVAGKWSPFSPFTQADAGLRLQNHHISTRIKAGRNFRYPTFNDWYWQPGGNPQLKPETGWAVDHSLRYSYTHRLQITATQFYNFIKNYIQWVPNFQDGYWHASNAKQVFMRGVEVDVKYHQPIASASVDVELSYTYTRAGEMFESAQLIYIPLHKAVLQVVAQWQGFSLRPSLGFTSARYTGSSNERYLPGYALLDIEAAKRFAFAHGSLNIGIRANNLTNQAYSEIEGSPLPGRNFEGFIGINFHQ